MYIIETTETKPILAVYKYIINANNKKDALSKFNKGDYEKVEHLKDLEILETTQIEITKINKG